MTAPRLESLAAVEAAAWNELHSAALDKSHPWRVPVLATAAHPGPGAARGEGRPAMPAAGARPEEPVPAGADARCVILREVDRAARSLVFYSDARSAKVRQIDAQGRGALVFWSAHLAWQLRLAVRLEVATAGLAISSRWAQLKMSPAAADYLSPLPPGSPIASPHPRPERSTREHFALLTAHVERLDWLELHPLGHRRAIVDAQGARWVVP